MSQPALVTPPAPWSPPPTPRPRWWLVALTLVWVLVLVAGGIYAADRGNATNREQTTVADARAHVDEAVARIAAAASGDGQAVVVLSGFEKVGECDVTVFRGGERYRRSVTAVVPPGTEEALLQRVAAGLPDRYQVTVRTGSAPRLIGDAGFYVLITGVVVHAGEVRILADTGECRIPGDVSTVDQTGASRAPVTDVLDRLRLTATDWREAAVACPEGGTTRTVEATAPAFDGALDTVLGPLPDVRPVVAAANLYAYTRDAVGVALRPRDEAVLVSATYPCQ